MLIRYSANKSGKLVKAATVYTKDDVTISHKNIDEDALRIIAKLRENNYSAYIVGGAVRDLLIDAVPKDFDIVTDATPQKIKRLFRNSRIIGKRFRLVHIFFIDKIFEISTFRSTTNGSVGNNFGTIDEDVKRRDFTVNALYYDPLKQQIIDYVGGVADVKRKVIKPVIPLKTIFSEDPVRMIRAIKYGSKNGFTLPSNIEAAIKKNASLLTEVSASRLTEELIKIISSDAVDQVLLCAYKLSIFMYLQPTACNIIDENKLFAQNYYDSLTQLAAFNAKNPKARLGERLHFLIFDFICILTDWEKETHESTVPSVYYKVWHQCRNFVLPMNPPRAELDFAVRLSLKKLGIKDKSLLKGSTKNHSHKGNFSILK
ncbi:MAG: polynucleotide adenylyltransferase PcnB [Treponemataceae bacterium]